MILRWYDIHPLIYIHTLWGFKIVSRHCLIHFWCFQTQLDQNKNNKQHNLWSLQEKYITYQWYGLDHIKSATCWSTSIADWLWTSNFLDFYCILLIIREIAEKTVAEQFLVYFCENWGDCCCATLQLSKLSRKWYCIYIYIYIYWIYIYYIFICNR